MLPSFDSWSLERLQSHNSTIDFLMFWGTIVIGILTVIIGGYVTAYNSRLGAAIESKRNEQDTTKDDARDAAIKTEREKRAEIESKLATAESKLVPRRIPGDVKKKLIDRLKQIPGPKSIKVYYQLGDSECGTYAADFTDIFRKSDFEVTDSATALNPAIRGHSLGINDSKIPTPDYVEALLRAFNGGGLMPLTAINEKSNLLFQPFAIAVFGRPDGHIESGMSVQLPDGVTLKPQ